MPTRRPSTLCGNGQASYAGALVRRALALALGVATTADVAAETALIEGLDLRLGDVVATMHEPGPPTPGGGDPRPPRRGP